MNERVNFSIRGPEGILKEGVWPHPIPNRGAYVRAELYGLEGRLLFIGTDRVKDPAGDVLIVRFLLIPT